MDCRITYVGTATFLLEIGGLRLLTDPVLDPAGSRETLRVRLLGRLGLDFPLVKLTGPALSTDELPELDAVLLSHDEHYDNLDAEGRALLGRVPLTLTTASGTKRLGGTAAGLRPWQSFEVDRDRDRPYRLRWLRRRHRASPAQPKRHPGTATGRTRGSPDARAGPLRRLGPFHRAAPLRRTGSERKLRRACRMAQSG